jgi:hypothetical protein
MLLAVLALLAVAGCGGAGSSIVAAPTPSPTASPTPSPTASPTPTQTSVPSAPLTFVQDPLLPPNTNQWPEVSGKCFFANDGYHVAQDVTCPAPFGSWSDFTVSVTVRQVSGGTDHGYALSCHIQANSQEDSYIFEVYGALGQWSFWKTVNGTAAVIQQLVASSAIHTATGATNELQVQATGSQFVLSINGTQVGQFTDTSYPAGYFGLGAYGTVEAAFTLFRAKAG